MESQIFGISTRAFLAVVVVVWGFAYLSGMSLIALIFLNANTAVQILLLVLGSVIGFINLALGYYLGQKGVVSSTVAGNIDGQETEVRVGSTQVTVEPEAQSTTVIVEPETTPPERPVGFRV